MALSDAVWERVWTMGRCFGKVRRDFKNGLARLGAFQTQQVESRRASGMARPLTTSWWMNSSRAPIYAGLLSWVSRVPGSSPLLLARALAWPTGTIGPSSHNGRFRWIARSFTCLRCGAKPVPDPGVGAALFICFRLD